LILSEALPQVTLISNHSFNSATHILQFLPEGGIDITACGGLRTCFCCELPPVSLQAVAFIGHCVQSIIGEPVNIPKEPGVAERTPATTPASARQPAAELSQIGAFAGRDPFLPRFRDRFTCFN
jgi:hypothetical protein